MSRDTRLIGAAAGGLFAASAALAVPQIAPTYTFCEVEDNDLCQNAQVLDASVAVAMGGDESVRDCFYLTGKLQHDCVWDIEPKCAMRVYDKPVPCRNSSGQVIAGLFYEPIIRSSNGTDLTNVVPLSDRTIRLGVAALMDAFDGTINGLSGNGPHNEVGEVTVKVFYNGGDGLPRGSLPDQEYVFSLGGPTSTRNTTPPPARSAPEAVALFATGTDALRVAFVIPSGVASVTIQCCNNTGQTELCYDVDNYLVTNLIPSKAYCIEVVGGVEDHSETLVAGLGFDDVPEITTCFPTDTVVGIFDKNCNLIDYNDDKRNFNPWDDSAYSKICAFAEVDGTLRFAVSGAGDEDFNGLYDGTQQDYFDLLRDIRIIAGLNYTYRQGASLKDESADLVNRYPRSIWDPPSPQNPTGQAFLRRFGGAPEAYFAHDECGGYCIKIQLAEHVDTRPDFQAAGVMSGARADMNQDGAVNSADLALLLSFWGAVQ